MKGEISMPLPDDLKDYRASRPMRYRHEMAVALIVAAIAGVVAAGALAALGNAVAEALGLESARRPLWAVQLENSTQPAGMDECRRASPDRGRPIFTLSKLDRSNEPYHHRTYLYSAEAKR